MTSAQVVETSVNVISNSPSQDYTHPDDRTLLYDMTPGFKPFTILHNILLLFSIFVEIDDSMFTNVISSFNLRAHLISTFLTAVQ